MQYKIALTILAFTSATLFSSSAVSMNIMTADEMAAFCLGKDGKEPQEETCSAYVRGFIDSAVATDPKVIENVTLEIEESYSQRAARTRVGGRLKNYGPSYYAQFCIQDSVPLAEITDHVQAALEKERARDMPARDLVYRVLTINYPCP